MVYSARSSFGLFKFLLGRFLGIVFIHVCLLCGLASVLNCRLLRLMFDPGLYLGHGVLTDSVWFVSFEFYVGLLSY